MYGRVQGSVPSRDCVLPQGHVHHEGLAGRRSGQFPLTHNSAAVAEMGPPSLRFPPSLHLVQQGLQVPPPAQGPSPRLHSFKNVHMTLALGGYFQGSLCLRTLPQ